jgi:hypothetical protein
MGADEYDAFRRQKWLDNQKPPDLTEIDLTPSEFKVFKKMREENPKVSKLTLLSWLEGQRYDPSKDPDFLQDARQKFRDWKHRVTS